METETLFNISVNSKIVHDVKNVENDDVKIHVDDDVKIHVDESDQEDSKNIFRFKFTPEFCACLSDFSKLHQYDDRVTYKDSWKLWVENNQEMVDNEYRLLESIGYQGNIMDKMFKSGRYYFRKKTQKEVKKRRNYVSIDKDVIESMDAFIESHYSETTFKPSTCYTSFCDEFEELLTEECVRLKELKMDDEEIQYKFKKTFKNRYYLFCQNKKKETVENTDK